LLGHFAIKKKRKLFPGSSVASPGLFASLHSYERRNGRTEGEGKEIKEKEKKRVSFFF